LQYFENLQIGLEWEAMQSRPERFSENLSGLVFVANFAGQF
jgi:hypothetical protein